MKWNDHPLAWKEYARLLGVQGDSRQVILSLTKRFLSDKLYRNTVCQIQAESNWQDKRRPYYDLYPGIAQAFTRIDLAKLKLDNLHLPLPEVLIRVPVGHEVNGKIRTILVAETQSLDNDCRAWLLSINDGSSEEIKDKNVRMHTVFGMSLVSGELIADRLRFIREHPICDDKVDDDMVDDAIRIVTAICLLKDDEILIEPLPLSSDISKWEATHDPSLIRKAEQRGKRGWAIGRQIELSPTFRRPHFAIRWCGPGGVDPRLRPVKGCIVLREKVKKLPTGYLTD